MASVDTSNCNLKDWVTLDELGLGIHLVKENLVISQDAGSSEKFMHGIKVLMAKNYIDNLSEETKKGMLEKARQGIWPSCAPPGYLNIMGTDGKRTITPNPALAPLIRSMFEWYATGQHSLKEIAKLARQDGMQYPKSKFPVPRDAGGGDEAMSGVKNGQFENWLPIVDAFRTLAVCPQPPIRAVFEQIQTLTAP